MHLIARGSKLADSMSAYLVDAILAMPMIKVHVNTEVVGGGGDGQLEWVTLRERTGGQEQHLPLASLFVMIGARPYGWLPAEVDRDPYGFLYTGAEAAACDSWKLPAHHILTKRLFRGCLQSATYDPARSNKLHPPSEKGRLWSPKSTNS